MFNLIKEGRNLVNEKLLETNINELKSFFICLNEDVSLYFQRVTCDSGYKWIFTKDDETSEYLGINANTTFKDLFEDIKLQYDFDYNGEDFWLRLFDEKEKSRCLIMPEFGRIPFVQAFAKNELNALLKTSIKAFQNDENVEDSDVAILTNQQKMINDDIMHIINLICAESHDNESLTFTMRCVDSLLRTIPLTAITDEDEWIELERENENIPKVWANSRIPIILKFENEDGSFRYENTKETLFKNEEGKLFYDPERSSADVTLPWFYKEPDIVLMTAEDYEERKDILEALD